MNTLLHQIAQKNPFRDFRVLNRQQLEGLIQLLSLQFLQTLTQCNPFWISKKKYKFFLYVLIVPRTRFIVNLHSIVALLSWNSLLETGAISEV